MDSNPSRVLCVDDEINVLEGLKLLLRKQYDVHTATSGAVGLETIQQDGPFAIVMSDMRMPVMDGATFLGRVKTLSPDSVRILLTGYADLDSAIAAVNEGHIFRFLTKPCPPEQLRKTFEAALEQHRLITAERILLEHTLRGIIKTLTDILALSNPVAFGRAGRIKHLASDLAKKLGMQDCWQIEVAAMLSQLSCITLPTETLEKLYRGQQPDAEERAMINRLPEITVQLIGGIPRLEPVLDILKNQDKPFKPITETPTAAEVGPQVLKIAADFDVLTNQGHAAQVTLDTMRGRRGQYDPKLLESFADIHAPTGKRSEIKEVPIEGLMTGMVFAEDVRMKNGLLLVARGFEVTPSFLERIRNFQDGLLYKSVKIVIAA